MCTFGLDRYGNLSSASSDPGCPLLADTAFTTNNQVVGYVYNGAGQFTSNTAGKTYGWNVEGELSSYQTVPPDPVTAGFVYGGLGRRVEETVGGVVAATFIYNALGDMVHEIDGSSATDYVYAPAGALYGEPEGRSLLPFARPCWRRSQQSAVVERPRLRVVKSSDSDRSDGAGPSKANATGEYVEDMSMCHMLRDGNSPVDGVDSACDEAAVALEMGSAAPCPNGMCAAAALAAREECI